MNNKPKWMAVKRACCSLFPLTCILRRHSSKLFSIWNCKYDRFLPFFPPGTVYDRDQACMHTFSSEKEKIKNKNLTSYNHNVGIGIHVRKGEISLTSSSKQQYWHSCICGNFLIWGIYFLIQTILKRADFYWMKKMFS